MSFRLGVQWAVTGSRGGSVQLAAPEDPSGQEFQEKWGRSGCGEAGTRRGALAAEGGSSGGGARGRRLHLEREPAVAQVTCGCLRERERAAPRSLVHAASGRNDPECRKSPAKGMTGLGRGRLGTPKD